MADTREYVVHIHGIPYTLLLSDADAAKYGDEAKLREAPVNKGAPPPTNKARS